MVSVLSVLLKHGTPCLFSFCSFSSMPVTQTLKDRPPSQLMLFVSTCEVWPLLLFSKSWRGKKKPSSDSQSPKIKNFLVPSLIPNVAFGDVASGVPPSHRMQTHPGSERCLVCGPKTDTTRHLRGEGRRCSLICPVSTASQAETTGPQLKGAVCH